MINKTRSLTSALIASNLLFSSCFAAESLDDLGLGHIAGEIVAQNSARSIVLSDANLITLGVVDFDPNEFVDFENINVGDESTLEQRSQLTTYSLPWNFTPRTHGERWRSQTQLRLSYIATEQELVFEDQALGNPLDETTFLLYAENNWRYELNQAWAFKMGVGSEILFYENDFDYRDPVLEILAPYFDRSLFNTSYKVWTLDPNLGAHYRGEFMGHTWEYQLTYRYAIGHSFDTDTHLQETTIEAGRLSNSLIFHYDTPDVWNRRSQIRLLARRIDLSADAVPAMGTHHYYELGAGWLVDTSNDIRFLDNIGIGLSLNIDSELSGGSVVILFNEAM
ncbi:Solitary outer membrane autotransporter beta-barrel domain [Gilvimarinus sp. DA14]|uniref:Solitary outer membrane autotransporter beta-barrel domain n=1 Tax=Gilvimarinus sp. DA14 TaxID=2956798 RepID=UPI0020B84BD2|nr:Solitary outer membrane autotransporter beta-barrel domain [Gilvimarinus sp. DA14]UTF58586.1 Solitary outer membrane autotransporter beta-barrel domain [Gilvimarinus sp. DA14]